MSDFYDGLTSTALALCAKFGSASVLIKSTNTGTQWEPVTSETSHNIKALNIEAKANDLVIPTLETFRRLIFVPNNGVLVEVGDKIDGSIVLAVNDISPSGQVVAQYVYI